MSPCTQPGLIRRSVCSVRWRRAIRKFAGRERVIRWRRIFITGIAQSVIVVDNSLPCLQMGGAQMSRPWRISRQRPRIQRKDGRGAIFFVLCVSSSVPLEAPFHDPPSGGPPQQVFVGDENDPAALAVEAGGARRPVQKYQRDWRIGVRLGANVSGALAHKLQVPPPALRRARVRDVSDLLPSPGQVGNPASTNTDAYLEHATMGHQSHELASERCDADRCLLARHAARPVNWPSVRRRVLTMLRPPGRRGCSTPSWPGSPGSIEAPGRATVAAPRPFV